MSEIYRDATSFYGYAKFYRYSRASLPSDQANFVNKPDRLALSANITSNTRTKKASPG